MFLLHHSQFILFIVCFCLICFSICSFMYIFLGFLYGSVRMMHENNLPALYTPHCDEQSSQLEAECSVILRVFTSEQQATCVFILTEYTSTIFSALIETDVNSVKVLLTWFACRAGSNGCGCKMLLTLQWILIKRLGCSTHSLMHSFYMWLT